MVGAERFGRGEVGDCGVMRGTLRRPRGCHGTLDDGLAMVKAWAVSSS